MFGPSQCVCVRVCLVPHCVCVCVCVCVGVRECGLQCMQKVLLMSVVIQTLPRYPQASRLSINESIKRSLVNSAPFWTSRLS